MTGTIVTSDAAAEWARADGCELELDLLHEQLAAWGFAGDALDELLQVAEEARSEPGPSIVHANGHEPTRDEPPLPAPRNVELVETYRYVDEAGALLFAVARCRTQNGAKTFRQARLDGGRWRWNLNGVRRVPYRLPRLLEHIAANERAPIYVVDGEKDVHAIEAAGGVATCCPGGMGSWTAELVEALAGARNVAVVADRDAGQGLEQARKLIDLLGQTGVVADVVQAAEGKDAADHLAAGRTLDELEPVDLNPDPPASLLPPGFLDAADLLSEPDPGPTAWLVDGLIVDQALVAAVGRWKTTKSYGLLDVCIAIAAGRPAFGRLTIAQPGPVIFVNEESGRAALWRRLDALCRGRAIDREELRGRLLVAPNARIRLDDLESQQQLLELGRAVRPRLFVFDPLARMKASARDENAQGDVAVLIDFLRLLRDETGAAVLFVHHTGHAGDRMRGSSDLESAWETRLTWKRDGQSPLVEIESEHREAEAGPTIGYRINWDQATRSIRFDLVDNDAAALTPLRDRVLAYVADHPKQKAREIAAGLDVRGTDVDRTLADLTRAGDLHKGRSGRLDKLGREIRDEVYTAAGASSQTVISDTPGTSHGTSHNAPSRSRTNQDEPQNETRMVEHQVARPDYGTNQDEPHAGHRGSVARPTPLGVGEPDEPPDEPPAEELNLGTATLDEIADAYRDAAPSHSFVNADEKVGGNAARARARADGGAATGGGGMS